MKPRRNGLLKKRVLARDGGMCAVCQRFDAKWEHDHVLGLWEGGADTLENSQTLCRHCHKTKTVGDVPIRAKTDRIRARHELTQRRRPVANKSDYRQPESSRT